MGLSAEPDIKRRIQPDEAIVVQEMLQRLTMILAHRIGIVEVCISKPKLEIFWDTEGGGQINPDELQKFALLLDREYPLEVVNADWIGRT